MLIPTAIGDYTDFFSSMHHAKNCGTIFRGPENPIPANWYVDMKVMAIVIPINYCLTNDILMLSGFTSLLHIMDEHHQLLSQALILFDQGEKI